MRKTRYEKLIDEWKDDPEFRAEEILFDLTEKICEIMKEKGINRTELARRMGVDKSYVTRLLGGPPNITIETLMKIAIALETDIRVELGTSVIKEKPEREAEFPALASYINYNTPSILFEVERSFRNIQPYTRSGIEKYETEVSMEENADAIPIAA
ncbi:MAG: helix-turn-helix transcriptional regulator [Candidatus Eremiobacteraeota bacterium]|nr:helix-turn-helix transcriptional regulator [Candidatus Eremiobacteraeota bacterium]